MKPNLFSDVIAAIRLVRAARTARKEGAVTTDQKTGQVPCYAPFVSILDTVEGCVLLNCGAPIFSAAQRAFRTLPHPEAHRMAFSPKDGEMAERAQFWKSLLRPYMTPNQLHTAMIAILRWYRHIKQNHTGQKGER